MLSEKRGPQLCQVYATLLHAQAWSPWADLGQPCTGKHPRIIVVPLEVLAQQFQRKGHQKLIEFLPQAPKLFRPNLLTLKSNSPLGLCLLSCVFLVPSGPWQNETWGCFSGCFIAHGLLQDERLGPRGPLPTGTYSQPGFPPSHLMKCWKSGLARAPTSSRDPLLLLEKPRPQICTGSCSQVKPLLPSQTPGSAQGDSTRLCSPQFFQGNCPLIKVGGFCAILLLSWFGGCDCNTPASSSRLSLGPLLLLGSPPPFPCCSLLPLFLRFSSSKSLGKGGEREASRGTGRTGE